jgi:cytochrome d ubiquinol oxidase subunit I
MRTADAVSPHSAGEVGLTLALFVLVYFVVFGAGTVFLLRLIGYGPHEGEGDEPLPGGPGLTRQQMRPMSAAPGTPEPAGQGLSTAGAAARRA